MIRSQASNTKECLLNTESGRSGGSNKRQLETQSLPLGYRDQVVADERKLLPLWGCTGMTF